MFWKINSNNTIKCFTRGGITKTKFSCQTNVRKTKTVLDFEVWSFRKILSKVLHVQDENLREENCCCQVQEIS